MKTLFVLMLTIIFSLSVFAQEKGTIVFSKSPINIDNPANLTTSFSSGDNIYAAAYFKKTIKKQCKGRMSKTATKYTAEIMIYKNGGYKTSMNPTLKNDLLEANGFLLDLAPAASNLTAYTNPNLSWRMYGQTKEGPIRFCEFLTDLDEGKTTIKLEIKVCYEVIASGEFTLEGNDFEFYENLMPQLQNAESKTVTMAQAKRNDPKLENEMVEAMKNSGNETWNGEIKKVVIIDRDWFIVRHKISGAILHHYIRAEVAIKKSDGCYIYKLVTFKQNYIGNKFDKIYWDGAGDRVKIPCENI